MSKKTRETMLLEELENLSYQLKNFEKYFKSYDKCINDKFEFYDDKFNSFAIELTNFKEIFDKTREYLLLELESTLDNYNQIQLQNKDGYRELFVLLKKNNDDNFSLAYEEIGRLKHIISEKDELIEILENRENESNTQINLLKENLSKLVEEKDGEISSLSGKNAELSRSLVEKDDQINLLNENLNEIINSHEIELNKLVEEKDGEISSLSGKNAELSESLAEKNNQNKLLLEELDIIKLNINQKDNHINSLKEEIKILNSTIKEKDQTLDFIGGH